MNEKQLGTLGKHAFRLNDTGNAIAKAANPQLADTFGMVRRIVDNLPPPGNYMRELQWKGAHPAVKSLLMQYNDDLAKQMANGLAEMQAIDEETAYKQLKNMNLSPTSAPGGINTAVSIPDLKINDIKLKDWFGKGQGGLSKWAKQNFDVVNKTVQRGIFEQLDTDTIASQIIQESKLAGFKGAKIAGDTAAARVYRQAQTLARTAVAEQNHQINERVWDANKEAMEGVQYEWVAALDSKTCEICAPMDGRVTDTREEQESWPIHPNCRCTVVPFDPDDPNEVNVQEVSKTPFTYKGKTLDQMNDAERQEALSTGGLYASKVRINGKMYYRRSISTSKDGYAGWLAETTDATKHQFFGSRKRVQYFNGQLAKGRNPRDVLNEMLKVEKGEHVSCDVSEHRHGIPQHRQQNRNRSHEKRGDDGTRQGRLEQALAAHAGRPGVRGPAVQKQRRRVGRRDRAAQRQTRRW